MHSVNTESIDIPMKEEFFELLRKIAAEQKSVNEWAEIESDDMLQSTSFIGGFSADEEVFCFSYFDEKRTEYWFEFSLEDALEMLNGRVIQLVGKPA